MSDDRTPTRTDWPVSDEPTAAIKCRCGRMALVNVRCECGHAPLIAVSTPATAVTWTERAAMPSDERALDRESDAARHLCALLDAVDARGSVVDGDAEVEAARKWRMRREQA